MNATARVSRSTRLGVPPPNAKQRNRRSNSQTQDGAVASSQKSVAVLPLPPLFSHLRELVASVPSGLIAT